MFPLHCSVRVKALGRVLEVRLEGPCRTAYVGDIQVDS
jgi:regulator of RNase E activity RraA